MRVSHLTVIVTNIFKNPLLRSIFLASLAITVVFPLYDIFFIHPSFITLLTKITEDDAIRTGTHLASMIIQEKEELKKDYLSDSAIEAIEMLKRDFRLEKLQIFLKSGEIVYSTDPKDIGEINKKEYFHETVARGKIYTKLDQKGTRSQDGKVVMSDVVETYVPLMDGNTFMGAFEIYYDITIRKEKLDKLLLRSSNLLIIIAASLLITIIIILFKASSNIIKREEMEEALRTAKVAAELANRTKSDFLANMSHELRTPLSAIIGFSELLAEQYFGKLNKKQLEYVTDIQESGKHLLNLINDILDLAKVEAGKMELEPSSIYIKDLLKNSMIMIKKRCLKHRIRAELEIAGEIENLQIIADERKIKQVMFNLLSNAAKFTDDGGSIIVEAKLVGEGLIISVADSGIGIDPEQQKRIFEEFYQVKDGEVVKKQGTGLGLSLTKKFVELHGGRIWVESEGKNRGSRFSFILPVKHGKSK